jgi:murein DD-endopeptidase MepM/ murein hydrolase activator NlpD
MRIRWIVFLTLAFFLAACSAGRESSSNPEVEFVRIIITSTFVPSDTASLTPTATSTPTASTTPTPTPTPTPTAPEIIASGNPRAYTLFDPLPQSGAPCGWADTLDFPLDPPNGASARGGGDFGTYRDRYEKFHAGEDWGLSNRSNFGQPVYSIGHGQVTYAQPLGWGADKGVVIVRHTFPDGSSFLSFYGHLDPPSVTLIEGTCVRRGDIVGEIGRPRTSPHLHFEIRMHLPYATGGGYWPSDPTRAGWLPPSKTINKVRLQVAPGVSWVRENGATLPLGSLDNTTFMLIQEDRFVGIDLFTGDEIWSYQLTKHIKDALLDQVEEQFYISDAVAGLQAYPLPFNDTDGSLPEVLEPIWEQKLPSSGRMELMPLPNGGVLVSYKDTLSAFSPNGDLQWEEENRSYLAAWTLAEDILLFTTTDKEKPLISADNQGLVSWEETLPGIPLAANGYAWLYAEDGLYQLDVADQAAQRVYNLPTALPRRSTAISMSDGSVLLLHTDTHDRRLLAFDNLGTLMWEFSVPLDGDPQLFELDGEIYLLIKPSFSSRGSYKTLQIFLVDSQNGQLLRIFEGGSRAFNPRYTWISAVNQDRLWIQIGDIGGLLFDPQSAQTRMGQ